MPNPNEVSEAAERYSQHKAMPRCNSPYAVFGEIDKPHLLLDAMVLADAYLALTAEDEGPVDEAWLRSIGFADHDSYGIECSLREDEHGYEVAYRTDDDMPSTWYYMDRPIKTPKTRSDVLRLLAALGIPLNPKAK